MKALVVIDIPEIDFESCRANVEIDAGKKKIFRSRRIIRPMPMRKAFMVKPDVQGYNPWVQGWNECLDEILGETKWNH